MTHNKQQSVVVVTGAGQGIGKAIALEYAHKGAIVVIAEIDSKKGLSVRDEIIRIGGKAFFFETDVSKTDQVEQLFKGVNQQFERLDILINNAGISVWHDPLTLSEQEWDQVIGTNLKSTFFASREAAKIMKTNGGGAIVNIASTRALMSEPNSEAYAASKGGILALTHALAASFAPYRITVNAVLPGWIETTDYMGLKTSDHEQHFSKRVGRPEDIARACCFLTQPDNNFITGSQLVIDGGMTRKMIYEE
jgi:NAD(P)-dependent dehydrogenase (short-subunit alcohol dehydrogenase family)